MSLVKMLSDRASDQIYNQTRLNAGNSANIRLLRLRHDSTPDSIECELTSSSLDCGTDYTAVSYVWGDASAGVRSVLLNGRPIPVGHNLWTLLLHLTKEQHKGYLWIDALCIQQTNVAEKNHQVAIMGQIYAGAKEILVWLPMESRKSYTDRILSRVGLMDKQESFLRLLSRNEYWTRALILQEFVLASLVTFGLGPRVISEETLYDQLLFDDVTLSRRLENSAMISIVRLRHRMKHRDGKVLTLFDMLNDEYRPMLCSDPRDRMYSILSLLDPGKRDRYPIQPDYTKPVTESLFELTKIYCVQHDMRSGPKKDYDTFVHQTKSLGEGLILFLARKLEIKDARQAALAAIKRATTDDNDALDSRHDRKAD